MDNPHIVASYHNELSLRFDSTGLDEIEFTMLITPVESDSEIDPKRVRVRIGKW